MTILEEARHSLILIEHDPLLYEDAREMTEYVSKAMSDAAKGAAVLLLFAWNRHFLEDLTKNADRVFYFDEGSRASSNLWQRRFRKRRRARPSGAVIVILGMIRSNLIIIPESYNIPQTR
jgi:DNA polymerase I